MSELAIHNLLYFGPWLLLLAFFAGLFIYGVKKRNEPKGQGLRITGCGCFTLLLIFFATTIGSNYQDPVRRKEAEVKTNLHTIQIALERWSVDKGGGYPDDINTLIDEAYMMSLPTNPFTGKSMRNVPFRSGQERGEFSYIAVLDLYGDVNGYYLFAYGNEEPDRFRNDYDGDGVKDNIINELSGYTEPFTDEVGSENEFPSPWKLLNPQGETNNDQSWEMDNNDSSE